MSNFGGGFFTGGVLGGLIGYFAGRNANEEIESLLNHYTGIWNTRLNEVTEAVKTKLAEATAEASKAAKKQRAKGRSTKVDMTVENPDL